MNQAGTELRQDATRQIEDSYSTALREYLAQSDEAALQRGYEIGRGGLQSGLSAIELARVHHDTLVAIVSSAGPSADVPGMIRSAAQFFAESIGPYEMAMRGFGEANAALRHLNETLEEETRRTVHTLHDEMGQLLVAASLVLIDLGRDMEPGSRGRVDEVAAIISEMEKVMRGMSQELRPTLLDDLGLVPALASLATAVSKRTGLPVDLRSTVKGRLGPRVEVVLYRIVQEALTNATKHSQASNVSVELAQEGSFLSCSIRDNGVGFDTEAALSGKTARGLGLIGIRERLNAVGGMLEIKSAAGRGTELTVMIPLES